MADQRSENLVDLATNLTVAWLSNPNVRANTEDATSFLENIHSTLSNIAGSTNSSPNRANGSMSAASGEFEPAVTVRKSLASPDKIISMIDGKPYTTLKRHLSTHGLTPEQYRERYGLKPDYPMVAPAYAEKRRALAKKIGLGRGGRKAAAPATAAAAKPKARPKRAPKATKAAQK